VAKKAGARFGDVVTVWALILEQASANVERGTFDPLDHETTDYLLGAEEGTTERILAAMEARGLTGAGHVARWEKRQPKREREDSTAADRKRQQRAREAEQEQVPPCHTTPHQKTPREEKSREEEKIPHTPQAGLARKSSSAISLKTYLEQCKASQAKPIPEDDSVFDYALKTGIPTDFLRLQWLEFKDRYGMDGAKRYKAWPSVFGKSVRGNWFKLWFALSDGGYALTTVGQQAKRQHGEAS
jgi:hypothetical protein